MPIAAQSRELSQNASSHSSDSSRKTGTSAKHRLYVEAECEHGCGYTEEKGWLERLRTDPVATFTAVLAALTLGLIVTGAIQVYWMRQTVSDATAQHVISNRAFVFLENFENIFNTSTVPGNPRVDARISSDFPIVSKWKNSGRTPSKNLTLRVNVRVQPGELPTDFEYSYGDPPIRTVIGPNANEWNAPMFIGVDEANRAARGETNIYVWGRADYWDVFDGTPARFTEFCSRVQFFVTHEDVRAQFVPYGSHNRTEADGG